VSQHLRDGWAPGRRHGYIAGSPRQPTLGRQSSVRTRACLGNRGSYQIRRTTSWCSGRQTHACTLEDAAELRWCLQDSESRNSCSKWCTLQHKLAPREDTGRDCWHSPRSLSDRSSMATLSSCCIARAVATRLWDKEPRSSWCARIRSSDMSPMPLGAGAGPGWNCAKKRARLSSPWPNPSMSSSLSPSSGGKTVIRLLDRRRGGFEVNALRRSPCWGVGSVGAGRYYVSCVPDVSYKYNIPTSCGFLRRHLWRRSWGLRHNLNRWCRLGWTSVLHGAAGVSDWGRISYSELNSVCRRTRVFRRVGHILVRRRTLWIWLIGGWPTQAWKTTRREADALCKWQWLIWDQWRHDWPPRTAVSAWRMEMRWTKRVVIAPVEGMTGPKLMTWIGGILGVEGWAAKVRIVHGISWTVHGWLTWYRRVRRPLILMIRWRLLW